MLVANEQFPPVILSDSDEDATWLRRRLRDEGLVVHPGSFLGQALTDSVEFARGVRGEAPRWEHADEQERLLRVGRLTPLFRQLRRSALEPLVSRDNLRLLTKEGNEKAANRVWELRVALAASRFALAPQMGGERENPDVSFFSIGGRWGVECLVLKSLREDKWLSKVAEKAGQLDDIAPNRGIIAIDASNIIDGKPFREAMADGRGARTRSEMETLMDDQLSRIAKEIDQGHFWKKIARHQIAGIFLHADAVTAFDGRLVHLGLGRMILRRDDRVAKEVAYRLLRSLGS